MQKASSVIMVVILLGSAALLSLSSEKAPPAATNTPPSAQQPATEKAPAPAQAASEKAPAPAQAATAAPAWPQENSDIPADPNARFGRLENGMGYLIYRNAEPPQRLSVRLHIRAGSLMEADDQRGIAHFLEHMMFNGTRNYTAEELIPKMQRLGIAFGAHANAYTSFDETVYMLDLPDLSEDTLELAFTVMRDFGDGALLTKEEIDKERGVILSEKISRDSVQFRLMQKQFEQLMPDSKISHRFPIGTEDVIKSAPRGRFVDFYQQYYTPERMTFIVVGDIDPATIEQRIQQTFMSMKNPTEPGTDPDLGSIASPDGVQAAVFEDAEVSSTDVSLLLARTHQPKPDTREKRLQTLTLNIAHSMLGRRFDRIKRRQNSPVADASVYKSSWFNAVDFGSIDITAADDRWQEVVPILENEFRRALEYGFNQSELAEAKSNVINAAKQAVEQKDSRKSESLATMLARSLNDGSVFSTPETNLEIIEKNLAEIDVDSCLEAFRKFWKSDGYHLVLTTKQAGADTRQTLLNSYQAASETKLDAPAARAIQVFDYTHFGKAGSVKSDSQVADLDIKQLVLSNEVRINLKQTDFEKGKVRLLARIGSGQLSQPKDMPMLDFFARSVFEGGGLGKHSVDDLTRILAGRNVSSSLSIGEDAFVLSGSTTAEDFLIQCQVMCASLIDPGFREEALWQFRKAIPMIEQQFKHTPAGPSRLMTAWLHGGDSRFQLADSAKLSAYTLEDAKAWLGPELAKGHLELSIIGDFTADEILPHLLATFGALPKRAATPAAMKEARRIEFPKTPAQKSYRYESKVSQGIATTIWKTMPMRGNPKSFRRLNVLGDILGNRLREEIREKLGASYSPNAGADGSEALDNMGYLISQSIGKPGDLPMLLETMRQLATKLSKDGASQDELDRSLKPIFGILEKTQRDNSYWLNTVMSRCQQDPVRLDLARGRDADYRSISLEEINALAAKYLKTERALSVSIQSE